MKGWRTILINALTLLVGVTAWPQVVELVDAQSLLLISAGANILLRVLTDSPVGQKE